MPNDTLTLALNGDVSLKDFAKAMEHFDELVQGLTNELARDVSIEWVIDTLDAGSATTTVKGETDNLERLTAVVTAYASVGESLQLHQPIPYPEKIRNSAQKLVGLLDGNITSLRFETSIKDSLIEGYHEGKAPLKPTYAYGRVKGTVQTLSARRGISFRLYDVLFDRPITCYLREEQEELIRANWGKKVYVSGKIARNPETGRPFAVREITDIQAVDSKPGGFRRARGLIDLGNNTSESIIRNIRNG